MKLMPRSMAARMIRIGQLLVDVLQAEVPAAEADGGDALAGAAEGPVGHLGFAHHDCLRGRCPKGRTSARGRLCGLLLTS